ncbi:MAG TPA: choice-of-anchor D domain-containing protein [Bryobacteraceae bacterium]|nr:choice-of-anchor D domain-containing protein [Bryobacteraceae bacterium]
MSRGLLFRSLFLLTFAAGLAAAQQFPFQFLLSAGGNVTSIPNGTTLTVNNDKGIGTTTSVHIQATYTGIGQVAITQPPQLLGSVAFTVTLDQALPLKLSPGGNFGFQITFKPVSTNLASSQVSIFFTETLPPTTGNTPVINQGTIVFQFQGTTPSFQLTYVLQSNPNIVALQSGGSVIFPGTLTNTTALATLNISNLGSGPGQIASITLPNNTAFKLTGLPLFPATLQSGQTLQLVIAYTPAAVVTDTDQIQITLASGTMLLVGLQGSGISAQFAYQLFQGDTPAPLVPPGPIALPDTALNTTSSVIVRVQNIGNANGILNAPSLAGPFQLSDLPLFPQTLKPNDSFTFTIKFTPTQPGPQTGQLVIGADLFTLSGNGLGPKLSFSYISAAGTITLGAADAVVFSPVAVTQNEQATFIITNTGTQTTNVSNIGIGEAKSPFSVSNLPGLPVSLDPNASAQFTITFTPATTGFSNGTLRIDTVIIPLTGSGTPPPPLPAYTIQGPSGNVAPQTQPAVRLSLASAYPVALVGTLTLTTSSNSVSDPAVQFSTGGKAVPFVIPANSTDASFAGQGQQAFLQTGTVASTITLTPNFLTQDGGIDLTPSPAATLQLTVPTSAPVLLAIGLSNATSTGFTVSLSGYSTTRSVNTLTIQFTAAPGFNLASSQATIDLRQASLQWFQGSASTAFGGQFVVTVPFTLSGTVGTGQTLLQAIASVSATVGNDIGTSNSLQIKLQ